VAESVCFHKTIPFPRSKFTVTVTNKQSTKNSTNSTTVMIASIALVRDGQTSSHKPLLVVYHSTCPDYLLPPREQLCNRSSLSLTHRRAAMGGFTQDDGYVRR
jgi:hypothetical protein